MPRRFLTPTPTLLASMESQLALSRRRVERGHRWIMTAYRQSEGYSEQFLISHGLLADEHVCEQARRIAWKELNTKLAFFAAFPIRSAA